MPRSRGRQRGRCASWAEARPEVSRCASSAAPRPARQRCARPRLRSATSDGRTRSAARTAGCRDDGARAGGARPGEPSPGCAKPPLAHAGPAHEQGGPPAQHRHGGRQGPLRARGIRRPGEGTAGRAAMPAGGGERRLQPGAARSRRRGGARMAREPRAPREHRGSVRSNRRGRRPQRLGRDLLHAALLRRVRSGRVRRGRRRQVAASSGMVTVMRAPACGRERMSRPPR